MNKKIIIAALAVVLLGAAAFAWHRLQPSNIATEKATIGGPFTLTDQNGQVKTDKDYKGQWILVFFGFTHCPDVCPTAIANMDQALKQLGPEAAKVHPIFITLDPRRDTPAELKSYLANFGPGWTGFTGNTPQIDMVTGEYKVYFAKQSMPESEIGYTINHSGFIYLMGPDGEYRAHFQHSDTPDVIAQGIRQHLTKG